LTATARQIRGGIWALDIALAVIGVFLLVSAIGHVVGGAAAGFTPAPLVDSSDSTGPGRAGTSAGKHYKILPSAEYAKLKKSKLFGALSSSNVAPKTIIDEELPETTLELELLGLVSQGGGWPGFAVIRHTKKRTENTYEVGDFIVDDARVEEIRASEVVISRAGKRETLPMVFSDKKSGGRFQARTPAFPPPRRTSRASSSAEPVRVINDNLRYVNKAKVMDHVSQNMASLMNQFRTSPNIVDGKPEGVGIEQVGSDPIAAKSGLRPGDVVKSVNGVRVNSIDDVLSKMDTFKDAPEVRVVVERDGRHRTLVYKIR
jgi:general secretion pathway protein C